MPLDSDDRGKYTQAHAGRTRATSAARSLAADSSSLPCPGRGSQTMLNSMEQPVALQTRPKLRVTAPPQQGAAAAIAAASTLLRPKLLGL